MSSIFLVDTFITSKINAGVITNKIWEYRSGDQPYARLKAAMQTFITASYGAYYDQLVSYWAERNSAEIFDPIVSLRAGVMLYFGDESPTGRALKALYEGCVLGSEWNETVYKQAADGVKALHSIAVEIVALLEPADEISQGSSGPPSTKSGSSTEYEDAVAELVEEHNALLGDQDDD